LTTDFYQWNGVNMVSAGWIIAPNHDILTNSDYRVATSVRVKSNINASVCDGGSYAFFIERRARLVAIEQTSLDCDWSPAAQTRRAATPPELAQRSTICL
jgi:hypothetical protein